MNPCHEKVIIALLYETNMAVLVPPQSGIPGTKVPFSATNR